MAAVVDTSTQFGHRVDGRLRQEGIIWLVTVRADGAPQPSPVWFLWDGDTFLIYSRPNTPKLRNIRRNPRVVLHLDSDRRGGDIAVISGEARIVPAGPPAHEVPAYVEKYHRGGFFASISMTPQQFAQEYSVAIRVTPTHLRGH